MASNFNVLTQLGRLSATHLSRELLSNGILVAYATPGENLPVQIKLVRLAERVFLDQIGFSIPIPGG